jgi:hypothetical protein
LTYKDYILLKSNKELLTFKSKEIENKIKEATRFLPYLDNALIILKDKNINVSDVIKLYKKMGMKYKTKDIQDMINCRDFLLSSLECLKKESYLLTQKLEIERQVEVEKMKLFKQFEKLEIEKEVESSNKFNKEKEKIKINKILEKVKK